MDDLIVIGGGPAGLMAAIQAAKRGLRVSVYEKNKMLGRKLRITGKGRCNITNACDFDTLMENIPGNGKFLFSAFRSFSNLDLMGFFEAAGLPLVTERGNRVFPKSQKAADVAVCLKDLCKKWHVAVHYDCPVTGISKDADTGRVNGIFCGDMFCSAYNVLIATGGLSYPLTGSTGDGYRWAEGFGHTIVPPAPSLVGLKSSADWVRDLEGLSLRNIGFSLKKGDKVIYKDFGELIFTAEGISGPVVLSGSRHILPYKYTGIDAVIDLKPALNAEKLDSRLQRDFTQYSRKQISNGLFELLPRKLIPVMLRLWGVAPDKFVNQITKEERRVLADRIKHFTLPVTGSESIDRAVVTCGGVKTAEIDPKTMESKLVKGLYFAGEVIDVDGYTGGYNLTIAFSTGYTAGNNVPRAGE